MGPARIWEPWAGDGEVGGVGPEQVPECLAGQPGSWTPSRAPLVPSSKGRLVWGQLMVPLALRFSDSKVLWGGGAGMVPPPPAEEGAPKTCLVSKLWPPSLLHTRASGAELRDGKTAMGGLLRLAPGSVGRKEAVNAGGQPGQGRPEAAEVALGDGGQVLSSDTQSPQGCQVWSSLVLSLGSQTAS